MLQYQIILWYPVSRKFQKAKYKNKRNYIFGQFKNYSINIYKKALERTFFPNYENLDDADITYNDFIVKLNYVAKFVSPFKIVRVSTNKNESFDEEIKDMIHTWDTCTKNI